MTKQTPAPGGATVESLLTYGDAAEVLGVTPRTVWALVDRSELPAVRFGGSVRIDPADLRAFIQRAKQRPTESGVRDGQ